LGVEKDYLSSEIFEYELKESGFKRLNRVLNYTFSRASENITVDEIAAQANLSKSQFSRFFKERTGKTFISFLNEVRIENACTQLLNTRESIEKISYDNGFQNISNFNRQFKKVKSLTPSQFRAELELKKSS
jgi:AraC-like DNA-binding protein